MKTTFTFPTFEEWIFENGDSVERAWQFIHDEYGDAAPLLCMYKDQKYREAREQAKDEYDAQDWDED